MVAWSNSVTKEHIIPNRQMIADKFQSMGITGRKRECWQPLAECAYLLGEDIYEDLLVIAKKYCTSDRPKLSYKEQMLQSLMRHFLDHEEDKKAFVYSSDFKVWCNQQEHTPWPYYGKKGDGVNEWNIADLLDEYDVKPKQEDGKGPRGYYLDRNLAEQAQSVLGMNPPAWWTEYYN